MELKPSQLGVWLLWRTPGRTHWLRCASGYDAQQHAVRNHLAIYHIIHGYVVSNDDAH